MICLTLAPVEAGLDTLETPVKVPAQPLRPACQGLRTKAEAGSRAEQPARNQRQRPKRRRWRSSRRPSEGFRPASSAIDKLSMPARSAIRVFKIVNAHRRSLSQENPTHATAGAGFSHWQEKNYRPQITSPDLRECSNTEGAIAGLK
jgi:hypothetical protein